MKRFNKKVLIIIVQVLFVLGFTTNTIADDDRDTMCVSDPGYNYGKCKHDNNGDHYCDLDADFLMDCWNDVSS